MLPQCPISNFAIVFEVEIKGKWHRHKHCFNLKNGGIFGEANGGHWLAYNSAEEEMCECEWGHHFLGFLHNTKPQEVEDEN